MHKYKDIHCKAALGILTYIKESPSKGLLYKKHGHLRIEAFPNYNYAGDKRDKKSISIYCTYVEGNLIREVRSRLLCPILVSKLRIE